MSASRSTGPRPYADPYVTGVGLGLVLLAAFVLVGRGLGASGAFATTAATIVDVASPAAARANAFFTDHLDAGGLLRDWLVVEVLGVLLGGFMSAALAGRLRLAVDRGPRTSVPARLLLAVGGGAVMGVGAVLARGCTSGQALTGGALLSVGSWIFVGAAFASAYAAAWLLRRVWT
ncbi:MAG: YeeE/YedE thiosulfate transporter family protein [Gemmatirosa sp.]